MSDNRRCPVQENTSRQKPERCSAETYHYRQPPTRTGPAALGQFVLETFLLNSHLSAIKCVRSVSLSTRPDLKHNHSPTAHTTQPNTSQPASLASDVFKGVCACMFKGEVCLVRVSFFCHRGHGCVLLVVSELQSSSQGSKNIYNNNIFWGIFRYAQNAP